MNNKVNIRGIHWGGFGSIKTGQIFRLNDKVMMKIRTQDERDIAVELMRGNTIEDIPSNRAVEIINTDVTINSSEL